MASLIRFVLHGSLFGIYLASSSFLFIYLFIHFLNISRVNRVNYFSSPQTILGDFQKEQQRFVKGKKAKQSGN